MFKSTATSCITCGKGTSMNVFSFRTFGMRPHAAINCHDGLECYDHTKGECVYCYFAFRHARQDMSTFCSLFGTGSQSQTMALTLAMAVAGWDRLPDSNAIANRLRCALAVVYRCSRCPTKQSCGLWAPKNWKELFNSAHHSELAIVHSSALSTLLRKNEEEKTPFVWWSEDDNPNTPPQPGVDWDGEARVHRSLLIAIGTVWEEGNEYIVYERASTLVCYTSQGPPHTMYNLCLQSCGNHRCTNEHHLRWTSLKHNKVYVSSGGELNRARVSKKSSGWNLHLDPMETCIALP